MIGRTQPQRMVASDSVLLSVQGTRMFKPAPPVPPASHCLCSHGVGFQKFSCPLDDSKQKGSFGLGPVPKGRGCSPPPPDFSFHTALEGDGNDLPLLETLHPTPLHKQEAVLKATAVRSPLHW